MSNPVTHLSNNPTLVFSGARATGSHEVAQPGDDPVGIWSSISAMKITLVFSGTRAGMGHPVGFWRSIPAVKVNVVAADAYLVASDRSDDVRTSANTTPLSVALNWVRLTRAGLSPGAYSKVFAIAARPDGWRGRGSRALSASSLSVFLKFWSVVSHEAAEPQFTLMPTGHLHAEWYKNGRRHLDLEFCDDWMIYCGLFNGNGIWEGKESIENVAKILMATDTKPLHWAAK